MISKEEYEKLRDKYCNYDNIPPNGVPYFYDSEYKCNFALYDMGTIDTLNLLEDKEFISKLSDTEIGFLVTSVNVRDDTDILHTINILYSALAKYYIDPNFHNKMQISFIKEIISFIPKHTLKSFYDIGYYYDELVERCKRSFIDSIHFTMLEANEYYNWGKPYKLSFTNPDIGKYSYEEYAITLDTLAGIIDGDFETCWKYPLWKHEEDEELKEFLSYL